MNRFHRALLLFVPLLLVVLLSYVRPLFADPDAAVQRRLIVNDNGEVVLPKDDAGWAEYLDERFSAVVGTQVDSYFLNIASTDRGPGIVDSLQSCMASWAAGERIPDLYHEAIRRYIAAARDAQIEIFASIRMNDVHDANLGGVSQLTYPFKVSHPELLLGNEESLRVGPSAYPEKSVMRQFWCGLDWASDEVRQHFLDFIVSHCAQYDFDGLELDYFRHPLFFKLGEEEENLEAMSEFVRKVRNALNGIGEARGRPYLLTVRVPETPARARRAGLDVKRWLKNKWLDLLIVGGGFLPHSAQGKDFIDLAHRYEVPAYPCLDLNRGPQLVYSVASNSFALGGDGFYLFNYSGVTDKATGERSGVLDRLSLRRIGDPRTLRWIDKSYELDGGSAVEYFGYNNAPPTLPVRLIDGRRVPIVVGDDVKAAKQNGPLKRARLHIEVADLPASEGLVVQVNGSAVPSKVIARVDERSFTADLPPESLRRGINELVFLHGLNSSGTWNPQVVSARLSVEYLPQYEFEEMVIAAASRYEPRRREFSAQHALDYVDRGTTAWTKNRDCIACHTNGSYVVTRPALTPYFGKPAEEHREFLLAQLAAYAATDREKLRADFRPTQVAYVAAGLAEWDAHVTQSLSAETRNALQLMFEVQGEAGDWSNITCWPPFESSAYQSTTVAALAAATAPTWLQNVSDETLRAGLEKMKKYLRSTPPPHDYGRLLLLWTATRLPDVLKNEGEKKELIDVVWKHQQDDGGWSIRTFSEPENWGGGNRAEKLRAEPEFENPPSDGHQTGLCVMVLRDAGVPADDPRIQKAVRWLLANQRESGRWWTRSLNTDRYHFITFSGTCYPLLALAKCGALPQYEVGATSN